MKLKPKSTVKNPKALLYKRFINLEKSENLNAVYKTQDNKFWLFDFTYKEFIEIKEDKITPKSKIILIYTNWVYIYQNIYFKYLSNSKWGWFDFPVEKLSTDDVLERTEIVNSDSSISGEITNFNILTKATPQNKTISTRVLGLDSNLYIKIYGKNIVTQETVIFAEIQTSGMKTIEIPFKDEILIEKIEYKLTNEKNEDREIYWNIIFHTEIVSIESLGKLGFNSIIGKYQTNKYYYSGSFDYIIKGSIEGTTTQYVKGNIVPLTSLNIKFYDDDITLTTDDLVVIDGHLYSVENPETVYKQQPKPFKIHFATLNNML